MLATLTRPIWPCAFGGALLVPAAFAQETAPAITVPDVSIVGKLPSPGLSRLTEPELDTPQTITEVPAQQVQDQRAVSLEEAIRYAPGISIHANEDTSQKNQFYGRGFSAQNDR